MTDPDGAPKLRAVATGEDLQARLDLLLSDRPPADSDARPPFSAFRREDVERANDLAAGWIALDGVAAVLEAAEQAVENERPELVQFALLAYLAHDPHGAEVRIAPLAERFPYKVVPSVSPSTPDAALQATFEANPESRLAWWREDPGLNEHLEHWHVLYNAAGVPGGERKDRHGELFLYLHRQMLARYEAERRAVGLDPVQSWWPFTVAQDPWGYDPGPGLAPRRGARGPNQRWQDAAAMGEGRQRLADAIERGEFADATALGTALEAWRNEGHGHFAALGGVMGDTATAARDHLFWRWCRAVDDLCATWQATQPAHELADTPTVIMRKHVVEPFAAPTSPPAVANRSPDIILSRLSQIPEDWREHVQEFGDAVFGGEHWDEEFASTSYTTGELQSFSGDEFIYFIRLDNQSFDPAGVTVRIFLAPQETADDRRAWMEMDKFRWVLKRSERAVVARRASLSSIIRKPGVRVAAGAPDYCDCGWPAHLLLPRGRLAGMRFRLLVMLTDWSVDRVPPDSPCGSFSFCGARDRYPDNRPMGYPFDRPLPPDQTIAQLVAAQPNMATRDITIRWMPAAG